MANDDERCVRCYALKSEHIVLRDADDDTMSVLLCPRATFRSVNDALGTDETPVIRRVGT